MAKDVDKGKKDEGLSGWNLSQANIILISNLMREATYLYLHGYMYKSYFRWKSIKFIVQNRFTPEERKKLRVLENKIVYANDKKISNSRKKKTRNYLLGFYYEQYVEEINLLLRKYKLDIADRERVRNLG